MWTPQTEISMPIRTWRVPPQDAPKEARAPLKDGIPVGGSPGVEGVAIEVSLEVAATSLFLTKLANTGRSRLRMLDRLLLSSYVPPEEWVPHLVDTMAHGPEGTQEIIDC